MARTVWLYPALLRKTAPVIMVTSSPSVCAVALVHKLQVSLCFVWTLCSR